MNRTLLSCLSSKHKLSAALGRHRFSYALALLFASALVIGGLAFVDRGLADGAPTISITTASLPDGAIGSAYDQFIAATSTNATDTLTWAVASGTLPSGLSLNSATGEIAGTSTAVGHADFVIQVAGADPSSTPATQEYTPTIGNAVGGCDDNTNPVTHCISILDFTDSSGLNSQTNADVNTATGMVQLKGTDGSFTAPFNASGTVTINDIRPRSVAKWGTLSIVATTPTGTAITVQVMGDGNDLYSDTYVPGNSTGVSNFPVDLSKVPVLQCGVNSESCNKPQMVRLQVTLTTSDPSVTPTIDSLQFTWTVRQGDLASSTFSNAPWAASAGNEQGTNQSRYSNPAIYPAIRWVGEKYVGVNGAQYLYALNDKLLGMTWFMSSSIFAVDRDNGSTLWQLPNEVYGQPVIAQNGTSYGTDQGNDLFYAIDTNTGQLKWTYNFYSGHGNNQTVIGSDGTVYTIRNNSYGGTFTIFAFNPDGTVKWTKDITARVTPGASEDAPTPASLSPDGTVLYFGDIACNSDCSIDTGKLYAVDLSDSDPDHSVLWTYDVGGFVGPQPLVDSQGTIYVGSVGFTATSTLYAINPGGTLKWEKSFGTIGEGGVNELALRSDGNLWMRYSENEFTNHFKKILEISGADGSTLWSSGESDSFSFVMSDSPNGAYFADNNYDIATATIARLNYYDANHNLKWQTPYVYDSTAGGGYVGYGFTNPVLDERGWTYSTLSKSVYDLSYNELPADEYAEVFAMSPWTLSTSTDKSAVAPGGSITFSATTAMQQTNLLTTDPNQMQAVLDTGAKVPLTYASTTGSGDTVWTGTYAIPDDMSTGTHAYAVEANAAGIVTDIPVHFDSPAANSSGTGIMASGTFSVEIPSPDASLSNLSIDHGTLTPSFATSTLSYTDSVANDITSLTVTATTTDASATIKINGTNATSGIAFGVSLGIGANPINVLVTAADTSTSTYTIAVTRAAPIVSGWGNSGGGGGGGGSYANPYTITVNGGATSTASTSVTLALTSTAGINQMWITNDPSFATSTGTGWIAFQASYPWTLTSGSGSKTVYAEFRSTGATTPAGTAQASITVMGGGTSIGISTGTGTGGTTSGGTGTLQEQLNALLAQLNALERQVNGESSTGCVFTRNLTVGSRGEDVRQLQSFLNTHGFQVTASGAGSLGQESTYFGNATRAALSRYQANASISPTAGYFGVITRARVCSDSGYGTTLP